jgi:hypothetical protein
MRAADSRGSRSHVGYRGVGARAAVAELERVNAVLRSASAYFAAELDQTRR